MKNIEAFGEQIADRDIALVGNSEKLFNRVNPIDQHEIVIRINRAWAIPDEKRRYSGRKLDFLFDSTEMDLIDSALREAGKGVVWMTPKKRSEIPAQAVERLYFYPEAWWEELMAKIGSRPSTGCMGVDLISRYIHKGHLTLYGFDFFQSHNWWQERSRIKKAYEKIVGKIPHGPHSGDAEKRYIHSVLPSDRLTVVLPD